MLKVYERLNKWVKSQLCFYNSEKHPEVGEGGIKDVQQSRFIVSVLIILFDGFIYTYLNNKLCSIVLIYLKISYCYGRIMDKYWASFLGKFVLVGTS